MTYREAILLGESILQKAKIVDAKNDAWLLLAMACRINHTYYYVHMDEEMSQEQIREYQALLSKRAERIPLQYIVGEQEFMGLKFRVNSNVLIPRQDTETLVEEALKVIEPGMWTVQPVISQSRRSMWQRKTQGLTACLLILREAICLSMSMRCMM